MILRIRSFENFFLVETSGKPLRMDASPTEEREESNDNSPILEINQDLRLSNRKQLAVHLILASIFFESIAFYALTGNIGSVVKLLNWNSTHGSEASYIFTGEYCTELNAMKMIVSRRNRIWDNVCISNYQ